MDSSGVGWTGGGGCLWTRDGGSGRGGCPWARAAVARLRREFSGGGGRLAVCCLAL